MRKNSYFARHHLEKTQKYSSKMQHVVLNEAPCNKICSKHIIKDEGSESMSDWEEENLEDDDIDEYHCNRTL